MSEQGDDSDQPGARRVAAVTASTSWNTETDGVTWSPPPRSRTSTQTGAAAARARAHPVRSSSRPRRVHPQRPRSLRRRARRLELPGARAKALGRRFSSSSASPSSSTTSAAAWRTPSSVPLRRRLAQFARNAARASSSAASPDAASAAAAEARAPRRRVRACAIVLASALVLTPLSMLRKTRSLGPTSSLYTVAALLYTTADASARVAKLRAGPYVADGAPGSSGGSASGGPRSISSAAPRGPSPGRRSTCAGSTSASGVALPTVFAFQCHIQILSFYAAAIETNARRRGRRAPPGRLLNVSSSPRMPSISPPRRRTSRVSPWANARS